MKLIVFDLDGTLLNTLSDLTDSVNYAMDKLGLHRYSREQVRMMIGNGVAKLMERAVTSARADLSGEALRLQRLYYSRFPDKRTEPYDGVTDMLSELKADGFSVAVHTNKDETVAKELCRKYFNEYVDYVFGTTSDGVTKPNPQKIAQLMTDLRLEPRQVIYCGDSDVDIITAKNLGVACISVLWGFREGDFLKSCGAKHLVNTPREAAATAIELYRSQTFSVI